MPEIPYTTPPHHPAGITSSRFASLISTDPRGCGVAILGLPDDLGVRLNHGRAGAALGPRAFREALARYGVADPHAWAWPRVFDAGDIRPAEGDSPDALVETHRRVTAATSAILDLGLFPIAIGGGHDLTFPFVRAIAGRFPSLAGMYFDAHLDVRETVGSGMAFRKLVEECGVRKLHVAGLNPLVNSREHVEWFRANGGVIHATPPPRSTLLSRPGRDFFLSFDLDCVDAAHAPGVSAMNPAGLSVRGACDALAPLVVPGLRCFDIMEFNPAFDVDGRTARVAAHLFLTFLRAASDAHGRFVLAPGDTA